MFSFHVDPDLDILFEKLIAQIGARLGLGAQLCFEAPGDLWIDIVKMQRLTLGQWGCPLENGPKLANRQIAVQKTKKNSGLHLKTRSTHYARLRSRGFHANPHSNPVFFFNIFSGLIDCNGTRTHNHLVHLPLNQTGQFVLMVECSVTN